MVADVQEGNVRIRANPVYDAREELQQAVQFGTLQEVRRLLIDRLWTDEDFDWVLSLAMVFDDCMVRCICLIDAMQQPNLNLYMAFAAGVDNVRFMEYLVGRGANSFNWALRWACAFGKVAAADYCIQQGATAFRRAVKSTKGHYPAIAAMLRQKQAEKGAAFREMCQLVRIQKALR